MLKKLLIAGAMSAAMSVAVATPAAAQALLTDWAIPDATQAFTAVGAKVTGSGTDESGALYVSGQTADGMKFLAYGTVCSATTKRCKGLNLSAGFTQESNTAVDNRVKEIDRMAVGVRNGGDNSLDVNRYIIFDDGISRKNLQMNLQVFLDIADDIWNGGGVD